MNGNPKIIPQVRVTQFDVLVRKNLGELIEAVNISVKAGWQPHHNLVVNETPENTWHYQAMVKTQTLI